MIKALIFDLDGTLADTIDDIGWAVNRMLEDYGFPMLRRADHLANINNGAFKLIQRSIPENYRVDEDFVRRCLRSYESYYSVHYDVETYAYNGVREALSALSRRGYLLSVLSNKQDAYVKNIVDKIFFDIPFVCAQGQTELPTKPDPTAPLLIAERMGLSPTEIAFVGDSQVDILTAKNAGMYPVGVSWGYRPAELLIAEGARVIAEDGQALALLPEKCV